MIRNKAFDVVIAAAEIEKRVVFFSSSSNADVRDFSESIASARKFLPLGWIMFSELNVSSSSFPPSAAA